MTQKPLPDLVVTRGVPFADQAEGIRQFKEACGPSLSCMGRCNVNGENDPIGRHIRLIYWGRASIHIVIKEHEAELLIAEIQRTLAQRPPPVVFATGDPLPDRKPCKRHSWTFDNATGEVRCTTPGCEAVR